MKIGILTYHRTLNYGACLQAVATRVALEKMGHNAYYVDYWPEYHQGKYQIFSWNKFCSLSIRAKLKYLFDTARYYKYRKQRIDNFQAFFDKYIIPFCRPENDDFDSIVYGSDQIWRKHRELDAYNPVYFGDNRLCTRKHIAYSASMGILPTNDEDKSTIKKLLSHFDKIAVREQDLKNMLEELGYDDVFLSIDPTLLLHSTDWDEVIEPLPAPKKKYVLVYGIGNACFDMAEIKKYAASKGCIVKVLSGTATAADTEMLITTADPVQFLTLIRNAECIFTSSFHGLAFSIIYHKEFYASYVKNSNRAETLLSSLEIQDRLIEPFSTITYKGSIDYQRVDNRLKELQSLSLSYLSTSISTN